LQAVGLALEEELVLVEALVELVLAELAEALHH